MEGVVAVSEYGGEGLEPKFGDKEAGCKGMWAEIFFSCWVGASWSHPEREEVANAGEDFWKVKRVDGHFLVVVAVVIIVVIVVMCVHMCMCVSVSMCVCV